jgi:chromosomal replication initiator protein
MYDLLNNFTENIRSQTMSTFRESYFKPDILCIDNFEYIADKEATQEEMFNILSYLINYDKVIVIASSKRLDELSSSKSLKSLITYGQNIEIADN